MNFSEWLDANWQNDNMLPPPLDAQQGIDFLRQYLLGENWYSTLPTSAGQINCEIVHYILYKYSKKYKKEYKAILKRK